MTALTPIPVTGVVQHYAWGDPTFIPELLGVEPDGTPWAELWLGTHPNGPTVTTDGTPLAALVGELPYLVKVLAAAEPLSLQVHPNAEQAVEGFARGAYPDDAAKPELLCALTPFDALCGIRPVDATLPATAGGRRRLRTTRGSAVIKRLKERDQQKAAPRQQRDRAPANAQRERGPKETPR